MATEGLNRVMLLGNLGADPEVRFTQGGQAVCHIRLACSESYLDKDKQRAERTEWVNVTIWGKRGEALGKILTKGSKIFVEGSLRTSSYDNREGQKVYKTEVIASNVILAGGGSRGGSGDEGGEERGYGGDDRGQGQGRGGGGGGRQQRQSAPRGDDGYGPPAGGGGGGGGGYSRGGGNGGGAARAPSPPADPEPGFGEGGGDGAGFGADDDIPF